LPEIRDIWLSINSLQYKDEPDYAFIRGKLKQIFERSQFIPRPTQPNFDYLDEKLIRQQFEMPNPSSFYRAPEMNVPKHMGYFRNNYHTQMRFSPYIADKNYIQYNHHAEYDNNYDMQKDYNKAMNANYSIGMTTTMQPQLRNNPPSLPTLADYQQAQAEANNFNFSLNQFLRLPYQIVMPPTEINQSISISNLPSLNDLAIRTGINTGMGAIFAPQRSMAAPSPVPMSNPQLLLPLSSFYSTN
jgi:hypothetical protein